MLTGILGDEAKLAFRTRPDGIARLAKGVIAETDTYWNQFTTLFDSASDVYSLILPNDIRKALQDAPDNVAMLIRVICTKLFDLSASPSFPSTSNPSVAAFASSFIRTSSSSIRNTNKEVLNCIRILQRIFPVVFEVENGLSRFEMSVLWHRPNATHQQSRAEEMETTPQFIIDDEEEETEAEPSRPASPKLIDSAPEQQTTVPSLAERLFSCLVDLMFCCGFTLHAKDHEKIAYTIWDKGIGSNTDVPPSLVHDANKAEVLRLLLVLLSRQIYTSPSSLLTAPSFYSLQFVQKTPRRHILTILCSMINTAYRRDTRNSLLAMKDKLPYNHLVFKGQDTRAVVIGLCLQILCAVLDFQSGPARDKVSNTGEPVPTARTNSFRHFISKLHREQDFIFLLEGVGQILESHLSTTAVDNILPGSKKGLPYVTENIFFLWKAIELNKKFRSFMAESDLGMNAIVHLLVYCLETKSKSEDNGSSRAISYIIQTLSVESNLHKKIATTTTQIQLPAKWGSKSSFGEFWVSALQYISAPTAHGTAPHPSFLIALANTAPYFRGMSVMISSKLIHLLTAISQPRFLLADEGHPRLLFFVLEAFNAILQQNSRENPNFVAAVVGAHPLFATLSSFTLASGLRQVAASNKEQADTRPPRVGKRHIRSGASEHSRPSSPMSRSSPTHSIDTSPASLKAQGKQKAPDDSDIEIDLATVAMSVGKNGFVPTEQWVASWQSRLPLDLIQIIIAELQPYHEELQHHSSQADTGKAASLPSIQHLVSPSPVTSRAFIWSDPVKIWASSTLWGEIYVHNMTPLGIWVLTNVRLFHVKQTAQTGLLSEAVGVVGGLLGRS